MLQISPGTLSFLVPFLTVIINQLSDVNYPSYKEYQFSNDFMTNNGVKFHGDEAQEIPPACVGGPLGKIPPMDFIIVGAGAAGSVIANKLALRFPKKTVLLIEEGDDGYANSVPPGFFALNLNSEGTHRYHAEQSTEYGNVFTDGTLNYVGKSLGGSTTHNNMYFVCGTDADYDSWANITGDSNWNYENMLPNIKDLMNMQDPELTSDPQCASLLGTSGPLTVTSYKSSIDYLLEPFLMRAGQSAGYEILNDINCGKWNGFVQFRATVKRGERVTAATAFLAPLKNQTNLMILKNAVVDKILFDGKKVDGVRVVTKRPECPSFNILAKKEVIISAGTFNSPRILLRSGIGRAEDLNPFNIEQKMDLNVGRNYKDHFQNYMFIGIDPIPQSPPPPLDPFTDYILNRRGGQSHISPEDGHGFINLYDDGPLPHVQWDFGMLPVGTFDPLLFSSFGGFKEELISALGPISVTKDILALINANLIPKSEGFVTLRDTNPLSDPRIVGNYNSHPDDVVIQLTGIRKIQEFIQSPVMQAQNAELIYMPIPACDSITFDTDDYWKCYIKYFSSTSFHPVGTCRMGKRNDLNAVVDNRLRVIGVKGGVKLRVADGSSMPQPPRGNTQCPVYAIGWRAAQMIIEDNE